MGLLFVGVVFFFSRILPELDQATSGGCSYSVAAITAAGVRGLTDAWLERSSRTGPSA